MKTAEEILKEYGNWNKEGLAEWHKDCIIAAMEEYAQQQVKNLNIPAVNNSVCATCGKLNNPYCSNAWHLDATNIR